MILDNIAKKILLSTLFIILSSLPLAGCGGSAPAQGGSGPVSNDGTIHVASGDGRIYALNPLDRKDKLASLSSREWVYPPESQKGSSSNSPFQGCGSPSTLSQSVVYSHPVVDKASLYFGTYDGNVYSLDTKTGQKRQPWDVSLGSKGHIISSPIVNKETLYVAVGKYIYALDKLTGKTQWPSPFQAEDRIWSNLVLIGDTLYFGSLDHRVYAISSRSGELRWQFATEGAIAATPLIDDNTLYIGSFDKGFYALDISSGKPRWTEPFRGSSWFWARAVSYDSRVYTGDLDGKVYAIYAQSGKPAWTQPFQAASAIRSSPVIVDGILVIASTNGHVYGLDANTGKERWSVPFKVGGGVMADLAVINGEIYVHAQDGLLYALEATTGRALWTFALKK